MVISLWYSSLYNFSSLKKTFNSNQQCSIKNGYVTVRNHENSSYFLSLSAVVPQLVPLLGERPGSSSNAPFIPIGGTAPGGDHRCWVAGQLHLPSLLCTDWTSGHTHPTMAMCFSPVIGCSALANYLSITSPGLWILLLLAICLDMDYSSYCHLPWPFAWTNYSSNYCLPWSLNWIQITFLP